MGQIICITLGKGGTGKSSFAVNCGAALARNGRSVLLIDADTGLRSLDLMLGVSDSVIYDLGDVLAGSSEPVKAIVETAEPGLSLLSAPQTDMDEAPEEEAFARLCKGLSHYYDIVMIDSPAGIGAVVQAAARASTRAVVIATPDPVSTRNAEKAAQMLSRCGIEDMRLVLNRVTPALIRAGLMMNLDQAIDGASLQLIGVVPEDSGVPTAAFSGAPLKPGRKGAALAYRNIAGRLEGEEIPLMKL